MSIRTDWITRAETGADIPAIREIDLAAFDTPLEADLVDALRTDAAWIDGLSIVAATVDDRVVGHALLTRCHIDDTPALCLGPVAVLPEYQRTGAGSAAVRTALKAAKDIGEHFVVGAVGIRGVHGPRLQRPQRRCERDQQGEQGQEGGGGRGGRAVGPVQARRRFQEPLHPVAEETTGAGTAQHAPVLVEFDQGEGSGEVTAAAGGRVVGGEFDEAVGLVGEVGEERDAGETRG
jgi:GNAT superfamily N-acetyltransferase